MSQNLRRVKAVFDPETMIVHDIESIDIFLPPKGLLLVAFEDDLPAGCACTRTIGEGIAELKRMYVRPNWRRKGNGSEIPVAYRKHWVFMSLRLEARNQ